jgi:DNA-binding LytR/AlgR family response regulator
MNPLKIWSGSRAVSNSESASDAIVGHVAHHHLSSAMTLERAAGERMVKSMDTFPGLEPVARRQCLRVAIKVRGTILFIHLDEVIAVQALGKSVMLHRNASSYRLSESISVLAEKLESHGFIRIHRSVLVNALFVEEIRPLSTGEYCLRVEGGKQYTVTRTYKKNLKSLAEFWIGTGKVK